MVEERSANATGGADLSDQGRDKIQMIGSSATLSKLGVTRNHNRSISANRDDRPYN